MSKSVISKIGSEATTTAPHSTLHTQNSIKHIVNLVQAAKQSAMRKVNEELITLYYSVGKYLHNEAQKHSYGDKFIVELASMIAIQHPELKGFNRRGLYRMKQFYELYQGDEIVSTVLTQLGWSQHLKIMSACKTQEQRHFYIQLAAKEKYSFRELERQIESSYYERFMLSQESFHPLAVTENIKNQFLDNYVLDFLDLPHKFSEEEFKKSILQNLRKFILEIGKDFTFVGEEYRVQVGNSDFYIDLLFYHRALCSLVAFELKIGEFKPEYVGKMNFYLEALDLEYKKENENPSVGVILCAAKDEEVVTLALNRNLSPTLVAEYTLKLPDTKILQAKLREITQALPQNLTQDPQGEDL